MPWCSTCDRFYGTKDVRGDGACPGCGKVMADIPDPGEDPEKLRRFSDEPAPWHFKVLVGATAIYLGWRLVQGLGWVAQHV